MTLNKRFMKYHSGMPTEFLDANAVAKKTLVWIWFYQTWIPRTPCGCWILVSRETKRAFDLLPVEEPLCQEQPDPDNLNIDDQLSGAGDSLLVSHFS